MEQSKVYKTPLSVKTPYGNLNLISTSDGKQLENNILQFTANPVVCVRYDEDEDNSFVYIKRSLVQSVTVLDSEFSLDELDENVGRFYDKETDHFSGVTMYKEFEDLDLWDIGMDSSSEYFYTPFGEDYILLVIDNYILCKATGKEELVFGLSDDHFNYAEYLKDYYGVTTEELNKLDTEQLAPPNNGLFCGLEALVGIKLNNYILQCVEVHNESDSKLEIPSVNLFAKMYSALKLNFDNVEIVGEPTDSNYESLELEMKQSDIDNSAIYMPDAFVDYEVADIDELGQTREIKLQSIIDYMRKISLSHIDLKDVLGNKLSLRLTDGKVVVTVTPYKETTEEKEIKRTVIFIHTINPDDFNDLDGFLYYIIDSSMLETSNLGSAMSNLLGNDVTEIVISATESIDFLRNNHIGIGF